MKHAFDVHSEKLILFSFEQFFHIASDRIIVNISSEFALFVRRLRTSALANDFYCDRLLGLLRPTFIKSTADALRRILRVCFDQCLLYQCQLT